MTVANAVQTQQHPQIRRARTDRPSHYGVRTQNRTGIVAMSPHGMSTCDYEGYDFFQVVKRLLANVWLEAAETARQPRG